MTTSALVKSGRDLVAAGTGEVIGEVPTFSMVEYLASVTTPASLDAQKKLAAAYDKACDSLIGENDVQKEGGRTFKKKSAWAKLGRHFNISTVVVSAQKEMLGETFCATVTVKAIAPWGQSVEGVGACATDEESGRRTITIADAIATAETRAHNRAISRLIAMGEVSAEEMDKSGAKREGGASTVNKTRGGEQAAGASALKTVAADVTVGTGENKRRLGNMDITELNKLLVNVRSSQSSPRTIELEGYIVEVLEQKRFQKDG